MDPPKVAGPKPPPPVRYGTASPTHHTRVMEAGASESAIAPDSSLFFRVSTCVPEEHACQEKMIKCRSPPIMCLAILFLARNHLLLSSGKLRNRHFLMSLKSINPIRIYSTPASIRIRQLFPARRRAEHDGGFPDKENRSNQKHERTAGEWGDYLSPRKARGPCYSRRRIGQHWAIPE